MCAIAFKYGARYCAMTLNKCNTKSDQLQNHNQVIAHVRYIDNPLYLYVVPSCATFALWRSCMVRVTAHRPEHPILPTLKDKQGSCNRCASAIPDKGLLVTVVVRII